MFLQRVVILPFHPAFNKAPSAGLEHISFFLVFRDSRVLFNTNHTDEPKILMVVFISLTEILLCVEISGFTSVSLDWDKCPVTCIAKKNCQEEFSSSSSSW